MNSKQQQDQQYHSSETLQLMVIKLQSAKFEINQCTYGSKIPQCCYHSKISLNHVPGIKHPFTLTSVYLFIYRTICSLRFVSGNSFCNQYSVVRQKSAHLYTMLFEPGQSYRYLRTKNCIVFHKRNVQSLVKKTKQYLLL